MCLFDLILGLKALTYVVQQDPKLALQHQMTIIECLDHPDLIIKREVRPVLLLSQIVYALCSWGFLRYWAFCLFLPADAGVALSDHKLPECHSHCGKDAGVPPRQQRRPHHHRLGGEGRRAGGKISFWCRAGFLFYCF